MKAVLAIRLAVYPIVVAIAVVAFVMRSDGSPSGATTAMFHGQTPEGELAAIGMRDGKVQSAYLRWRMTCEVDRSPDTSTIRFGPQYGDRFDNRGREFSFEGRSEQPARDGHRIRYDVELSGRVSEDGRSATGRGRTIETWVRNGHVVDVCRSKDVPWTVHRGVVRD